MAITVTKIDGARYDNSVPRYLRMVSGGAVRAYYDRVARRIYSSTEFDSFVTGAKGPTGAGLSPSEWAELNGDIIISLRPLLDLPWGDEDDAEIPPGQVTGLTVTPGNAQNVLSWNAPASGGSTPIFDYRIDVSTNGGASWSVLTDGVGTLTSYTHTSLTNGVTYTYRVSALNNPGVGMPSLPAAGTPLAPDTIPNGFTFTAQTGIVPSTLTLSDVVTLGGTNAPAAISVSGGEYRINGGAWTSSSGTVAPGSTVQVRQTASSSFSTATTTTLTIGGVSGLFTVTTGAADTTPDGFVFTAQTGAALSTVYTSNIVTVAGVTAPAAISVTGGEYRVNGGSWTSSSGTVSNADTVQARVTSSGSFSTGATATVTIGGVSAGFTVTTAAADTTPDAFGFSPQTDGALSTVYTSNAITVSGITAAAAISVSGGEYRIDGGSWTSSSGTVTNGQTVEARQTSSASNGATTTTTVTIGGVAGSFAVTTIPSPSGRVAQITTAPGGRTAVTPQSFYDDVAVDVNDANNHPSVGPFTHNATKNGNWSDPTLWDTGTVPGEGASVNLGTYDVTYNVSSTAKLKNIHNSGTGIFRWANNTDTLMWVYTILLHGTLIMGEPGASSVNRIVESATTGKPRAEVVFWGAEAPGTTVKMGLVCHGSVRMYGAIKEPYLQATATIPAGATSVTIPGLSTKGWRSQDRVLFPSTEYAGLGPDPWYTGPIQFYGPTPGTNTQAVQTRNANGFMQSRDEVRVVTRSGDTLSWTEPLLYDHKVYTRTLPRGGAVTLYPVVANLSRSIRFRTASNADTVWVGDLADLQKRAQTMFMGCPDIEIDNVEFLDMGRTSTDPSLVRPDGVLVYTGAGGTGTLVTNANNVRGRYGAHFHLCGDFPSEKQARLSRSVLANSINQPPGPGWGVGHHRSNLAIEKCILHRWRGGGLVSEIGSEIGHWERNLVSHCMGDGFASGWASRQEEWPNHNGHSGVGCENQSRQILQRGNIVTSCYQGWLYQQQDPYPTLRSPHVHALRIFNPLIFGGEDSNSKLVSNPTLINSVFPEQAQIPDFDDNVAYGCEFMFWLAHRSNFIDKADTTPAVFRRMHAINCREAVHIENYTYGYNYFDCLWLGVVDAGDSYGASLGDISWEFNFANIRFENFTRPIRDAGVKQNYNGFVIDCEAVNCDNTWPTSSLAIDTSAGIDSHPYKDFMGPWSIVGTNSVRVRDHAPVWTGQVAGTTPNLPSPYPLAPLGKHLPVSASFPEVEWGDDPYFVWDDHPEVGGTIDATVHATTRGSLKLSGIFRDMVGDRRWPDYQKPSNDLANIFPKDGSDSRYHFPGHHANGTDLVNRVGCWNDGGTWKTRMHFFLVDRAQDKYCHFSRDITLNAVEYPAGFLEANELADPDAAAFDLPLLPESLSQSLWVKPTATPLVVSDAAVQAVNGQPLLYRLRANRGQGHWHLSGPDAALFEVADHSNLRFLANAAKSLTAPADDANADRAYEVTATFEDQWGNESAGKAMTVTLQHFLDTFDGDANLTLDSRYGWYRFSGQANQMRINGSGLLMRPVSGSSVNYKAFDLTSADQRAEIVFAGTTSKCGVYLRYQDDNNWLRIRRLDSPNNLVVDQRKTNIGTGVSTTTEVCRYSNASGNIEFQVVSNVITVSASGSPRTTVSGGTGAAAGLTSVTLSDPPPNAFGCGLYGQAAGGDSAWLSQVRFMSL